MHSQTRFTWDCDTTVSQATQTGHRSTSLCPSPNPIFGFVGRTLLYAALQLYVSLRSSDWEAAPTLFPCKRHMLLCAIMLQSVLARACSNMAGVVNYPEDRWGTRNYDVMGARPLGKYEDMSGRDFENDKIEALSDNLKKEALMEFTPELFSHTVKDVIF